MKSLTAILFAAVVALAFTSAAPTPEILQERELTTENQDCKRDVEEVKNECFDDFGGVFNDGCWAMYIKEVGVCDQKYPYSVAKPVAA
ncbi:MAG: hypothetical protein J3R72DRAFT_26908 [Linnemannia gamsii]|nr:MAG: hypothetical protein J3R72DRAFT_26908 [Linnemannia gamsii]